MKTDIQLNFYDLECIYTKLDLYIQQIEELEATAIRYYRTISEQLSDSFQVETEMWDEFVLMKIVALRCYADTNKDLVEKYLTEMQAIIAPNDPTKMMRVDSVDICANLAQVQMALLGLADVYLAPSVSYPDYKATIWANFFSGLSVDERMELEQQECRNRQENHFNMTAIKAALASAIANHVDNELWTLYNTRIKVFEDKDDELGQEAKTFYEEFDAFKDYATDFLYKGAKFVKGFGDAAVGTLDGICTLGLAVNIPVQIGCYFGILGSGTEQRVQGFNQSIKWMYTDPIRLLENVGQGITDTLETEGISYIAGGMAFESLLGYGCAKVIEKIADWAKAGKNAGKVAKVVDEGGTSSWVRNLDNTSDLNVDDFLSLKDNGVVKVNTSGSDRPLTGAPNSYYKTGNGEHIFVYDGDGKLIYDISSSRVKGFKINVGPNGIEHYQAYKLEGVVPDAIKKLFGW